MPRLIRFEDAYGMADLVCLAHGLELIKLESNADTTSLEGVNQINYCEDKDTYYECGITFPTLLISTGELVAHLKKYNIDELILVYDMDSPKKGEKILSKHMLERYLLDLRTNLDNAGLKKVCIKLVPAVWASETFALYILASDYNNKSNTEIVVEPTELIHAKNTARFHSKIIEEYLRYYGIKGKAKHLREYINNQDVIIDNLKLARKKFSKSINKKTISWVIENNDSFLFEINEAIQHQESVNNLYNNYQPQKPEVFEVMGTKLDMNKKCW